MKYAILFFAPLLSGLLVFLLPDYKKNRFRLLLVFAGAYLFAITVSHLLPELYRDHTDVKLIGLWVLIGFFLQLVLEYFSTGIEHGHIHVHPHHHGDHAHSNLSAITLLLALCVHAFLEGAMLTQPSSDESVYDVQPVLIGITLHRMPAAFALMVVLVSQLHSAKKAFLYLVVFAAAAPLGLLISDVLVKNELLTDLRLHMLYALVCGNFLHISTTIVFESSPDHSFNAQKLVVALMGAAVAIGAEYLV